MRLLLVEADVDLAQLLCRELSLDGHVLTVIADGTTALESVAAMRPDVMILDLSLKVKEEMGMMAAVAEQFRFLSVFVLTARPEIEQTVRCLELGADDVVHKPFSFHELRARLRALARRRGQYGDRVLRFADLEMDLAARRVTQAGRRVELTVTEFSLLESLVRRRGKACSRSELLREVWQMPDGAAEGGVGANTVEVYINYLRKKLNGRVGRYGQASIRTVRGKGYALDAGDGSGEAEKTWSMVGSLAGAMKQGWAANV